MLLLFKMSYTCKFDNLFDQKITGKSKKMELLELKGCAVGVGILFFPYKVLHPLVMSVYTPDLMSVME